MPAQSRAADTKVDLGSGTVGRSSNARWEFNELTTRKKDAKVDAAVITGAKGLKGRIENFHALDLNCLNLRAPVGPEVLFKVLPVPKIATSKDRPRKIWINVCGVPKKRKRCRLTNTVTSWLVKNAWFGVVVGGLGARNKCQALKNHLRPKGGSMWGMNKDVPCALVPIINTIGV